MSPVSANAFAHDLVSSKSCTHLQTAMMTMDTVIFPVVLSSDLVNSSCPNIALYWLKTWVSQGCKAHVK